MANQTRTACSLVTDGSIVHESAASPHVVRIVNSSADSTRLHTRTRILH